MVARALPATTEALGCARHTKTGGFFMQGHIKLKVMLAALGALSLPFAAHATYNANTYGVITNVRVYDDGLVLLTLQNQSTITHPSCAPAYFAIDRTLDPNIRAMLLSRALVARSSGEVVNIGYDGVGSCANGYIRVHEIGG
jgi:hypothetical protein